MRAQNLIFVTIAALLAAAPAQASVEINASPTKNMNCAGGTCSPTAKSAVLNTTDLANMLATSDVKITTGNGAVTITVSGPFSWTSTHRLTLDANLNVSFRAPVEVAGQGAVTIITSDGGTGGDVLFFPSGKLDFWDTGSNLVINGTSYTLVSDIASIASAYATGVNNIAVLALAKDYDAGPDGPYQNAAVPTDMEGQFEGLGHTISNLSVHGNGRGTGFFAQSNSGFSFIRDITLSNVNIVGGTNSLTGALGGALHSVITNTHASGHVSAGAGSSVGGLVGYSGQISNSDSSAIVTCTTHCNAGGLVGFGYQITRSSATGTVTVENAGVAGGLVGSLGNGQTLISQSYATGDVFSNQTNNTEAMGGLAGSALQDSTIVDSYALGAIHNAGTSSLGGLVGSGQADIISTSYATGGVEVGAPCCKNGHAGGLVGYAYHPDAYKNDYWDIDTSGRTSGCGKHKPKDACRHVDGLSDAALKSALPVGFNPAIWAQSPSINNGYPYLIANPPQ